MKKVLVTGGAGFIGSSFVRLLLAERPGCHVTVLDKLTYAGRRENVPDDARVTFVLGDICDPAAVSAAMEECDAVFNFAAESHVDRSLMSGAAGAFVQTDVHGVFVLLEEARKREVARFIQVSTDEVYGEITAGSSVEDDPLRPRSPYAATKAAGELLAASYCVSHGVSAIVTRGSNTFGPRQYPEKLIPLFITNAMNDQALPLYGDGLQQRDWLYVEDHARGVLVAAEQGEPGHAYNIGGGNGRTNREIGELILGALQKPLSLLRHVTDRPGHDRRYSLNSDKLAALGWQPRTSFKEALAATVEWYSGNGEWWKHIRDEPGYRDYYQANYATRLAAPANAPS